MSSILSWPVAAESALETLAKAAGNIACEDDEEIRILYYHAGSTLKTILEREQTRRAADSIEKGNENL